MKNGFPHISKQVEKCIKSGVYDNGIIHKYSVEECDKINSWIDHERDFLFTYAGVRQVVDKYLVQDRSTGEVYESPQFMYMLIAVTIFSKYPQETRLDYVKRYYQATVSYTHLTLPTIYSV